MSTTNSFIPTVGDQLFEQRQQIKSLTTENQQLRAEHARYKAALEGIVATELAFWPDTASVDMRDMACKALKAEEGK
jgi:regulator of replication initiation timing